MNDQAWHTALGRWGDELWRLAVLHTGDRGAAHATIVQVFARAFATPPADVHAALLHALLHPPRRLHFRRQRALPRALRRIAPNARVLLALWLVQEQDGQHLASVAQVTHRTLVEQLAAALLRFLPRHDLARQTQAGRMVFTQWLTQQLGFHTTSIPDSATAEVQEQWQKMLARVRDQLVAVLGRQRLPGNARDAIEAEMTAVAWETPGWQRRAGWLTLAVVTAVLVWVLRPASLESAPAIDQPVSEDPRTLVQETLDNWVTTPVSGTLHRRVWAIDLDLRNTPAFVTDVWLGSDGARHRVEMRQDGELVEWQIGNGSDRLQYAANAVYSTCRWGARTVASNRAAYIFNVGAEEQAQARDARLQHGLYGQGFQALNAALRSTDLRSFGTRIENNQTLVLLSYSDPHILNRQLLLQIDPSTHQLQAIRELRSDGGQTTARDLWRLEHQEWIENDVSTVPPSRPAVQLERDHIFDPACLNLDPSRVLSVRTLAGMGGRWFLPTRLPPDIEAAALVTTEDMAASVYYPSQIITAVYISPYRSLRIRAAPELIEFDNSVRRGPWHVAFETRPRRTRMYVCQPSGYVRECQPQDPTLIVEAQGWSEQELLELVDQLSPVNEHTWVAINDLFLDPQPLDPDVQRTLMQSAEAINVQNGLLQTTLEVYRNSVEQTGVSRQDQPPLSDPYAVPSKLLAPDRIIVQQATVLSDSTVVRLRQLMTLPDGTIASAIVGNGTSMSIYDGLNSTQITHEVDPRLWWGWSSDVQPSSILHSFLRSMTPIRLSDQGDVWVLEQSVDPTISHTFAASIFERYSLHGEQARTRQAGTFVEQLQIDKATGLPRRSVMLQRDADGSETVLNGVEVREWGIAPVPPNEPFNLPPLPKDTMAYVSSEGVNEPILTSNPEPLLAPAQALVWRNTFEVAAEALPKPLTGDVDRRIFGPVSLTQMLNTSMEQLHATELIRTTAYRLPNSATLLTVKQGAAPLLRYALRNKSLGYGTYGSWTSSRPVSVTIAGQQRTAWILEGGLPDAVLVVEVDDVLLHITCPDTDFLTGPLLDALPQLQWVDQWDTGISS